MPPKKRVAAVAAKDAGDDSKKTEKTVKKTERGAKDKLGSEGVAAPEDVRGPRIVRSEDSSDGEDISSTDVSSDEETVGGWSTATKKGRKGKQIVYICAGVRESVVKKL